MRIALLICAIVIVVLSVATVAALARDREAALSVQQTPGMALAFDAAEADFRALTPVLSMSLEDNAKLIIRQRLIVCAMVMQRCTDAGTVVTRERPSDGFEHRKVTQGWIQPYIDQVSQYPEWKDRNALVIGVLAKVSG